MTMTLHPPDELGAAPIPTVPDRPAAKGPRPRAAAGRPVVAGDRPGAIGSVLLRPSRSGTSTERAPRLTVGDAPGRRPGDDRPERGHRRSARFRRLADDGAAPAGEPLTPVARSGTAPAPTLPVNDRIARRRAQVEHTAESRRRRRQVSAAVVLACVVGVVALALSPVFGVSEIEVVGTRDAGDSARIVEASGVAKGTPMIRVLPSSIRKRLLALPDIASVRVEKHWRGRLSISVTPERPVAVVVGPTNTAVIGEHGIVIRTVSSATLGAFARLPRLEGVAPASLGRSLMGDAVALAQVAADLGPTARLRSAMLRMNEGGITLSLRPADAVNADDSGPLASEGEQLVDVRFGTTADTGLKAKALEALLNGTSLIGFSSIDLGVPDAPILGR